MLDLKELSKKFTERLSKFTKKDLDKWDKFDKKRFQERTAEELKKDRCSKYKYIA